MAKKDTVFIDIQTSDGGSMQRVAVSAKKLGLALDDAGKASTRTGKSSRTLDRNLKGTADMTANNTKGFSKMAQGMTGTLVPAYAVLASNVFAITAAFQFLKQAADFRVTQESQIAFTAATGVGMQTLTNSIRDASGAMLDFQAASEAASIGIASGLGAGQIEELAAGAGNLSKILGRDVTDSFNRLVRGVTKAEPELLDELGITLRLADAQENYAATLGKSAKDLSTYEKKQAVFAEVQSQLEVKYNAVAKATDVQANAIARLGVAFSDVMKTIKGYINVISEPVAEFFTKNVMSLAAALALLAVPIVKAIIPGLNNWAEKSRESADEAKRAYKEAADEIEELEKAQKRLAEGKGQGIQGAVAGVKKPSAGVAKIQRGEMDQLSKQQVSQLLRHAEQNTGVVKQMNKRQKADYIATLRGMQRGHNTFIENVGLGYRKMTDKASLQFKRMAAAWKMTMAQMQKVTAKFTRGADLLFKGMGLIGIALMIKDLGAELLTYLGFFSENKGLQELQRDLKQLADTTRGIVKEFTNFVDIQKRMREELAKAGKVRDVFGELSAAGRMTGSYADAIQKNSKAMIKMREEVEKTLEGVSKLQKAEMDRLAVLEKTIKIPTKGARGFGKFRDTEEGREAEASGKTVKELNKELKDLRQRTKDFGAAYKDAMKDLAEPMASLKETTIEAAKANLDYFNSLKSGDLTGYEEDYKGMLEQIASGVELTEQQIKQFEELADRIQDTGQRAKFISETLNSLNTSYNAAIASVSKYKTANTDLINSLTELQTEMNTLGTIGGMAADSEQLAKAKTEVQKQINVLNRLRNIEIGFANEALRIEKNLVIARQGRSKIERDALALSAQILNKQNEIDKITKTLNENGKDGVVFDEKKIEQLKLQRDILKEQTKELERQRDFGATIADAGREGLASGLQGGISALLKGEESSIKDAMLGIMKGVVDNMIDAFSKNLTEKIMGAIPGFETQEQKMKSAIDKAHTDGAAKLKTSQEQAMDSAVTKFATAINEAADRFAAAIRDACSSSACMGHSDGGGTTVEGTLPESSGGGLRFASTSVDATTQDSSAVLSDANPIPVRIVQDPNAGFGDPIVGPPTEEQMNASKNASFGSGYGPTDLDVGKEEEATSGLKGVMTKLTGETAQMVTGLGLAVTALFGNSKIGQKLQKVMAVLHLVTLAKALYDKMMAPVEKAVDVAQLAGTALNTSAVLANTAALAASTGGSALGGFFGFAKSGLYPPQGYSTGGVAKGPRSGYPTVLHGNEAVVPLPDGKSIPISMPAGKGMGGMQNNNVGVTVNIDNQGNSSTDTDSDRQEAAQLGERLAEVVREELINQKRNGGILSPYGAV